MQKPLNNPSSSGPMTLDMIHQLYTATTHDLCVQTVGGVTDGLFARVAPRDASIVAAAHQHSPLCLPIVVDSKQPPGQIDIKHAAGGPPLLRVINIGGLQPRPVSAPAIPVSTIPAEAEAAK